jgi:hypothetical protein
MAHLRIRAILATLLFSATAAVAQTSEGQDSQRPPNVPPEGLPRGNEQLPEAPPEEILKQSPPLEKKQAPSAGDPGKAQPPPLPNTLPPAQKIEPKVPNT